MADEQNQQENLDAQRRATEATNELERAIRAASQQLATMGRVTDSTARELDTAFDKAGRAGVDASQVLKNAFKKAADSGLDLEDALKKASSAAAGWKRMVGDALENLAQAAIGTAITLQRGNKGLTAYDGQIQQLSGAVKGALGPLQAMGPGLAAFGKALGVGADAATALALAATDMGDKLYTSFGALNRAGGAAADGMTGLFNDAKNLGLSMNELSALTDAVAGRAQDFALFGGSVADARKRLGQMGDQLRDNREQFLSLGMTMPEVTEGLANYVSLQSRLGRGQSQTTAQMAESAKKYLMEQDALTKLLGINRQEQEAAQQRAMLNDQFMAKIRELQLKGQHGVVAELIKMSKMYAAFGPESEAAFHGAVTNNLAAQETVKGMVASNGEMLRTTQAVINDQMKGAEAVQLTGQAMGKYLDTVGVFTGQMKTNSDIAVAINEQNRARILTDKNLSEEEKKIQLEQIAMGAAGAKAQDPLLAAQAKLQTTQTAANDALDQLVKTVLPAVQSGMQQLTDGALAAAQALGKLSGEEAKPAERVSGGFMGADMPQDLADRERALEAAMTDDERSGLVRGLAKDAEGIGRALADFVGLVSDDAGEVIDGIVDQAQKSRIESEQQYLQERGRAPAASAPAPTGADAVPAGTTAAPAQSGTLSAKGGGPPQLDVDDYIKFTGGTGSRSHFDRLQPEVQQRFLDMAREYSAMFPGQKLQVNSAFRSPEEQANVDPGSNPRAAPGRSLHQQGRAIDIQSEQARDLISSGLLARHGFKSGMEFGDPPHIYMRDGGVIPASPGGTSVIAGEGGMNEAFVPLPDGRNIPVEIKGLDNQQLLEELGRYLGKANRMYRETVPVSQGGTALEAVSTSDSYMAEVDRLAEMAAVRISEANLRGLDYKQALIMERLVDKTDMMKELAQGGVTQGPSIAGEAGPEAVVPLPDNRSIPVTVNDATKTVLAASLDQLNSRLQDITGQDTTGQMSASLDQLNSRLQDMSSDRKMPDFGYGDLSVSIDGLNERIRAMTGASEIKLREWDMEKGGTGPTVGGYNAWKGINAGAMTTDLAAIKDIAGQLGAFDKATQTITNPETWQTILQSGIGTNMQVGGIDLGTRLGGADIGIDIGDRIKDIMATKDTDLKEAMKEVTKEFNAAMAQVFETIKGQQDTGIQMEILQTLNSINRNQGRAADASQRMADVAMN